MSRTVSARIPSDLHEELRERCNQIGESINDFIKAAIELGLYGDSNFNFGDNSEEESEIIVTDIPEESKLITEYKIYDDDGKLIHDSTKK